MKIFSCLVLAAAVAGCSTPPEHRGKVSAGLEQRAGHGLGPKTASGQAMPPSVSLEDGLTEDEAVTLALWNNAAFLEALADLDLSRADLIQAGMLPNPSLSMLFPIGAKPFELTAKYPVDVLWLRPRRVAASKLDYEKTAERLMQTGLDLIRDVKFAFADLSLAQERVKLAEENARVAAEIHQITQSRLKAGDISELEAGVAAVDTLQLQEQLARGRYDVSLVQGRLRNLTGLGATPTSLRLQGKVPATVSPTEPQLLERALANRPDLRASELALEAAGKRIGIAKTELFAVATGINAKDVGPDFLAGPALDFTVPLFNQNQGGKALAKANFEKAARQYATVKSRITLEVHEAHSRLLQARESYAAWNEKILPPLETSVRQSERAYAAGDVSYLLILESTRKLAEARLRQAAVAADLHRAIAELERNIGGSLSLNQKNGQANAK